MPCEATMMYMVVKADAQLVKEGRYFIHPRVSEFEKVFLEDDHARRITLAALTFVTAAGFSFGNSIAVPWVHYILLRRLMAGLQCVKVISVRHGTRRTLRKQPIWVGRHLGRPTRGCRRWYCVSGCQSIRRLVESIPVGAQRQSA